jgi:hypothetical protein
MIRRRFAVALTMCMASGCAKPSAPPPATPDVYGIHPKTGELVNISQAKRNRLEADKTLARVKAELRSLSAEQLVGRFNAPDGIDSGDYPQGARYFIVRDGNKLIEAELRRRGDQAKAALKRHLQDVEIVFTGGNGLFINVGAVCEDILAEDDPILYHLPTTRSDDADSGKTTR